MIFSQKGNKGNNNLVSRVSNGNFFIRTFNTKSVFITRYLILIFMIQCLAK